MSGWLIIAFGVGVIVGYFAANADRWILGWEDRIRARRKKDGLR